MTWFSYTGDEDLPVLHNLGPGVDIHIEHNDPSDPAGFAIFAGLYTVLATGLTRDEALATMEALVTLVSSVEKNGGVVNMAAAIRRKPPTPIHDTTVDGALAAVRGRPFCDDPTCSPASPCFQHDPTTNQGAST